MPSIPPPLADVDIRLLRIFSKVVDCNGFSQAETELGITRSTISTHMASLETRLGFKLCHRGRGGFALTEQGQQVYHATTTLLAALEAFRGDVSTIRDDVTGDLHVGLTDNMISDPNCPVTRALSLFAKEAPNVRLTLHVVSPNELQRGVLDKHLHLAIAPISPPIRTLEASPLYEETVALYCGAAHPFFQVPDEDIDPDQVRSSPFAERGYQKGITLDNASQNRQRAAAYHMEGIAFLILTGQFLGYLPVHYAQHWLDNQQMRVIRPNLFTRTSRFSVLRPVGQPVSLPVSLFLKALGQVSP